MTTLVMINGVICRPEDAKVSVFDRGLLFGDSVFETVGTYRGRPFALTEHLTRLRRSAELVFIELPVDDVTFRREIEHAIEQAQNPECYVRIIVTRGTGEMGLDPELAIMPQRIVLVTPLVRPSQEAYDKGVGAITYRTQRTTDDTGAVGAKVGNYLVMVLAMREAKRVGAVEALVVDREGRIVEGATSNVFLVKGGELLTPPDNAGILLGITRSIVLQAAAREAIPVRFACPTVTELLSAEEVFISSSIRQVLALTTIDGHTIGRGSPGPWYGRLFGAFRAVVEERLRLDASSR